MVVVSFVLPFCNEERSLSKAVDSVLQQTFTDFELILVDNGSSDNSLKIALSWEKRDKRVRVIQEPRQGIAYALNRGIDMAKGKYIARMDADDVSYPMRCERQTNYLNTHPSVGLVAGRVHHASSLEESEGMQYFVDWNNSICTSDQIFLNRFIETPVIHPSVMFRKSLVQTYGGYRQGAFPEDYELWLRWLHQGVVFTKLEEPVIIWNDHGQRLTRTNERYSRKAFYQVKTNYLVKHLKQYNPFYPRVVVFGAGRTARRRARLLMNKGIDIEFFVDIKHNRKQNIHYYKDIPEAGHHFVLSYIAKRGAREEVRFFLTERGYVEGKDFLVIG